MLGESHGQRSLDGYILILLIITFQFSSVRFSRSVVSDSLQPHGLLSATCQALLSMGLSSQGYWSGLPCPPPGALPNPWIEPRSPTLQVESLLSEPPGVPKNTGVCNQSLLQGNFPTQGWNWGLLHCRQILYQLRYQEANRDLENSVKATRRIKQGFVHLAQAP